MSKIFAKRRKKEEHEQKGGSVEVHDVEVHKVWKSEATDFLEGYDIRFVFWKEN